MSTPLSPHLRHRRETYISPPLSLSQAAQIHSILQPFSSSHDVPPEIRRGSGQSASSLVVASTTATAPEHSPAETSEARVSSVVGSESHAPVTVTQDEDPTVAGRDPTPPAAGRAPSFPSRPAAEASPSVQPVFASLAVAGPSKRGSESLPRGSTSSAGSWVRVNGPPFTVSSAAAAPVATPATETDSGTGKEAREGRGKVLRRFFLSRWVARQKREVEAERRAEIRAGKQKERTVEDKAEEGVERKAEVENGVGVDRGRRMERGRRMGRGLAGLTKRVAVGTGS